MSKKERKPGSGGYRKGAGRPVAAPTKTMSFKIPVFVDPIHEDELKKECRVVIDGFVVGKERVR